MKKLKLTIDLLPKGAWGNNLSKTLPKKDWDVIRENCYARAKHTCAICGYKTDDLDAHEVWDFDIESKTQRLKDIIALCSRCHGVKHMRNSERLGAGENAKRHFLDTNKCDSMIFAHHYTEVQFLFEARNEVLRWKLVANLDKFGGKGIEVAQREIPLIINPYESANWDKVKYLENSGGKDPFLMSELGGSYNTVLLADESTRNSDKAYFTSQSTKIFGPPKIRSIIVDNYQGTISITAKYAHKIQCIMDSEVIKTKFNVSGKFLTEFKAENLKGSTICFKLFGEGGEAYTQEFNLIST